MKCLFFVFAAVVVASCGSHPGGGSADKFVGVFARHVADSTGSLDDTFYVSRLGAGGGNSFSIRKTSGIVNVDDQGKRLPRQYKEKLWNANYQEDSQTLNIQESNERYALTADGISNGQL